jgi:hypothetical protein
MLIKGEKMTDTAKLLEEKAAEYGDAWLIAGNWLHHTAVRNSPLFTESLFVHNFVLIFSKMARALHSPYNVDHWRDAAGYATLVANWITEYMPENDT